MIIFERKYPVNIFNTDLTGKLSLGGLFNFFEDLAGRHAEKLGWGRNDLMTNGTFWALSRIVVKIDELPKSWDDVTLRTWPRGTETIFALRDMEMYDSSGRRLVGASSSWVIVDYHTRRAQRPDKEYTKLNMIFPKESALDKNAGKIPPLPQGDHQETTFKVKLDDIDVNRHVNNARYVHWAINCYDPEFITMHTPEMIEVNYIMECHHDETINILTGPCEGDGKCFIHSVTRKNDGMELCRLRISWKENRLSNLY